MKFSIIVPIYNADKYLHNCLTSIIRQTEKDFEVILVDDGSTDTTPTICEEFKRNDTRFKVIHKKNGGVSAARNTGLQIAQGEWLCFVDADDEVKPQWLENFAKNINDDLDIIIQGASVIDNDRTRTIRFSQQVYSKNDIAQLISFWQHKEPDMGSLWTKAIRTSIVKNNKLLFITTIKHYEDWIFFTYCLLYARSIQTINTIGYIYNHYNSTLTGAKNKKNFNWRISIFHARYNAAQDLKKIDKEAYWIYMEKISLLMIQSIYRMYLEKCPKDLRIATLKELSSKEINIKRFPLKTKIMYMLWLKKYPYLTDKIYSIFRII